MNYGTFSVYTYVADAINANGDCYVTSKRERTPESLPCVFLREFNRARSQRYATLANDDDQYESTFEAEIYADEESGSMLKVYDILGVIENAFKELGYFETFCEPIDNFADASIFRMVARFTKQIGMGDVLPST